MSIRLRHCILFGYLFHSKWHGGSTSSMFLGNQVNYAPCLVDVIKWAEQTFFVQSLNQHGENGHAWTNHLKRQCSCSVMCSHGTRRSGLAEMRHWCWNHMLKIRAPKATAILVTSVCTWRTWANWKYHVQGSRMWKHEKAKALSTCI